jgi:integrase/recombinase XerD
MGLSNPSTRKHYKGIIDHYFKFLVNMHEAKGIPVSIAMIPGLVIRSQGIHVAMWRKDLRSTGGVAGTLPGASWKEIDRWRPNTNSSIESKTSALSSFFKFLAKPCMDGTQALVTFNPVDTLQTRHKIEKYSTAKKIDTSILKAMLKACNVKSLRGLRNYTLLFGYYMTGRRNSEWLRLRWGDINWNTSPPTYQFTFKGRKVAQDEIPSALLRVLQIYLRSRWGQDYRSILQKEDYLFGAVGKAGVKKPIAERQMLKIVKQLAATAGLDPSKIEVHSLRHLNSEEYLAAGATVEDVRARLHHQNLATTQRYVSAMSNEGNPLAEELDRLLNDAD